MIRPRPQVSYFLGSCPDSGLELQATCFEPIHMQFAVANEYRGVHETLMNDELLYQWRNALAEQGVDEVLEGVNIGGSAAMWCGEVLLNAYQPDDLAWRIAHLQRILPEM